MIEVVVKEYRPDRYIKIITFLGIPVFKYEKLTIKNKSTKSIGFV